MQEESNQEEQKKMQEATQEESNQEVSNEVNSLGAVTTAQEEQKTQYKNKCTFLLTRGEKKGQICGKGCRGGNRCYSHSEKRLKEHCKKANAHTKQKKENMQRQIEEDKKRIEDLTSQISNLRVQNDEEDKTITEPPVGFKLLYEDPNIRIFGTNIKKEVYFVATDIEHYLEIEFGHINRYCAKHGIKRININIKRADLTRAPRVPPYCFAEKELYVYLISKAHRNPKARELSEYFTNKLQELRQVGRTKLNYNERPLDEILENKLEKDFDIVEDREEWRTRDEIRYERKKNIKKGVREMNENFFSECDKISEDSSLTDEQQRAKMIDMFFKTENKKYQKYGEKGMKYSAMG